MRFLKSMCRAVSILFSVAVFCSCGKEGSGGGTPPPPKADFVSDKAQVFVGDTVIFSDRSLGVPVSWSWTFSGGTPGTSDSRIPPRVVYNTPGTFNVKLVVRNAYGLDSLTKVGMIRVITTAALPGVVTGSVTNITFDSAVAAGNVINEGSAPVTERGICWDSLPDPNITRNKIVEGSGPGAYTTSITGLSAGKRYYVKAYAINADGVGYGAEANFDTKEFDPCEGITSFTDSRDGKVYRQITIGSQVWMADNLNFDASGSWCYSNESANCNTYGRLYMWEMAKEVCPDGWSLPTDADWSQLISFVGANPGGKLKDKSTGLWSNPNLGAQNSFCFTALPGGYRNNSVNQFSTLGFFGYWWSASADGGTFAICRSMTFNSAAVERLTLNKTDGLSVRCIKN
jgi:uncharacterized protein (TIGR02145 family)